MISHPSASYHTGRLALVERSPGGYIPVSCAPYQLTHPFNRASIYTWNAMGLRSNMSGRGFYYFCFLFRHIKCVGLFFVD